MKRKTKLFFSLASLCFSLAVLCFGVYSAMSVSYSISGSVSYEVTDAFVDITTTVYSSNVIATTDEELLSLANEFVNTIPSTIGDNKTVTHVSEYDDVFDFNTLTGTLDENNGYTPETSLDLTFGTTENVYTYFVVVNIKNLADNVVYTKISNMTDNVEGLGLIATDSNLRIFSDQESGQSIVFGYAISDLTKSQDNTPITFSIEITSQAPYTYAEIEYHRGAFLDNYYSNYLGDDYSSKIKNVIFTNNKADFDMTEVVDTFDVGDVYNEENVKVAELYTYFIPNGDLYDAYCYAPVNVIYAPYGDSNDDYGFFSSWILVGSEFVTEDELEYIWKYDALESVDFKAFDTSKTTCLQTFFNNTTSLQRIKNFHFDTSYVLNFMGMFLGVNKLQVLDISDFTFNDNVTLYNTLGFVGINDQFLLEQFGNYATNIIEATNKDEKILALAQFVNTFLGWDETSASAAAYYAYNTSIQKIICPKDLNGLVIATPGETPYLIEGTNEKTFVLVEGATLIAQN